VSVLTPTDTVCLVTIHGIGFQQAPNDAAGVAGYADALHAALRTKLGDDLSDDPRRVKHREVPGECGPIYVQSSWALDDAHPLQRSVERGLERLGSRPDPCSPLLDVTGKDLFTEPGRIAHVALVYTPLEEQGPDRGALVETATLGLLRLENYNSLHGELTSLGVDIATMIHEPSVAGDPPLGNIPRSDEVHHQGVVRRLLERLPGGSPPSQPAGPFQVLRDVEDDAAAYIARNELRERTRDFVREVLLRLSQRSDVTRIVVNAHSQGSLLAFDTLRTVPCEVMNKIAAFLTMGTPLRKAVTALSWGQDVGQLRTLANWAYGETFAWGRAASVTSIPAWTNLWDRRDPVADPLAPGLSWRRDLPLDPAPEVGLFLDVDPQTGSSTPYPVDDFIVSNIAHVAGGGLRAHDYWDNTVEVVPRLADRLRHLIV
jgi:hypothetical protein